MAFTRIDHFLICNFDDFIMVCYHGMVGDRYFYMYSRVHGTEILGGRANLYIFLMAPFLATRFKMYYF